MMPLIEHPACQEIVPLSNVAASRSSSMICDEASAVEIVPGFYCAS